MPPLYRPHIAIPPAISSPPTLGSRALLGAITVPQGYGYAPFGPSPGIVVGIVLGSVVVFLLLLTVFYWCMHIAERTRTIARESVAGGRTASSVVSRHRRPSRRHHHRRGSKHSPRRHEKSEQQQHRRVVREEEEIVVVEEFTRNAGSPHLRSPSPSRSPLPPPPSTGPPPVPRSDVIVVEEEHSAPRPRTRTNSIRSQHTKRSDDRRSSVREDAHSRVASRQRSGSRV